MADPNGVRVLTPPQVRWSRTRSQWLADRPGGSAAAVAGRLVGLQSQDSRMARLLVRPRGTGIDEASVRAAADRDRAVVRTWAMRGTLHTLAAGDLRWIVGLLGPIFAAAGRGRRRRLGLTDDTERAVLDAIAEILAGGEALARGELTRRIADRGVVFDGTGQAPAHLVAFAALRGLICRAADIDGEPTYALMDAWSPAGRAGPTAGAETDSEAAVAELARRYLIGYGPAGVADLASWSGLAAGRARRGISAVADDFEEVRVAGEPAWMAPGRAAAVPAPKECADDRAVRLLGHFDPYLLGYRRRDFALDAAFAPRVQRGGGFLMPVVIVAGRVVGTWRRRLGSGRLTVTVDPFERLSRATWAAVAAEVADLGAFLGLDAELSDDAGPAGRTG